MGYSFLGVKEVKGVIAPVGRYKLKDNSDASLT